MNKSSAEIRKLELKYEIRKEERAIALEKRLKSTEDRVAAQFKAEAAKWNAFGRQGFIPDFMAPETPAYEFEPVEFPYAATVPRFPGFPDDLNEYQEVPPGETTEPYAEPSQEVQEVQEVQEIQEVQDEPECDPRNNEICMNPTDEVPVRRMRVRPETGSRELFRRVEAIINSGWITKAEFMRKIGLTPGAYTGWREKGVVPAKRIEAVETILREMGE